MNIANLLKRSGTTYNEDPAIAFAENITLTYQELAKHSIISVNKIRLKHQLTPDKYAAVITSNSPRKHRIQTAKKQHQKNIQRTQLC